MQESKVVVQVECILGILEYQVFIDCTFQLCLRPKISYTDAVALIADGRHLPDLSLSLSLSVASLQPSWTLR
jgi:hypothetical protein